VCLLAQTAAAQFENLDCWVYNTNDVGIKDVRATLKAADVYARSSFLGHIVFADANSQRSNVKNTKSSSLEMTISRYGVGIQGGIKGQKFQFSMFDMVGRKLVKVSERLMEHGCYIPFRSGTFSSGIYLFCIETDGFCKSFVLNFTDIKRSRTVRTSFREAHVAKTASVGKKNAEFVDTLVFEKFALETVKVPISSYDTTVEVTMAYTPDLPSAPEGMKAVAGDQFFMGSRDGQANERPVHRVNMSPFYMDSTEVTQKSYAELTGKSPWTDYSGAEPNGVGENLAAWHLNWYDAVYYCNERSKRDNLDTVYSWSSISGPPAEGCTLSNVVTHYEKNGYRLPTEAEWEYAAKAGTRTDYYWGDSRDVDTAGLYAWYRENSDNTLHPVGSLLPNDFELFDICGGLSEWTNDWYRSYDPSGDEETDPTGPPEGSNKVTKGGAIRRPIDHLRPARRGQSAPTQRFDINGQAGFRCVRKAP